MTSPKTTEINAQTVHTKTALDVALADADLATRRHGIWAVIASFFGL